MTSRREDERYDRRVYAGVLELLGALTHRDSMSLPKDRLPVPVAARLALVVAGINDPVAVTAPKPGTPAYDRQVDVLQTAITTVRRWQLGEPEALLFPSIDLPQRCGKARHVVRLTAGGSMQLLGHPHLDLGLEAVSAALGGGLPECLRGHLSAAPLWPPPVADDGFRATRISAGELFAFVELIRMWFTEGYDLWSAAPALLLGLEPVEVRGDLSLGLPVGDALVWRFSAPAEVGRWQACGFDADDAATWRRQGRTLEELEASVDRVPDRRWLARWAQLVGPSVDTEAVIDWAGFGLPVGVWGEAAYRGLRATDVKPWTEAGFGPVEILRYAHLRTPLGLAEQWRTGGFSAYVACSCLGVGMTLAEALELQDLPMKLVLELWPSARTVDGVRKALA